MTSETIVKQFPDGPRIRAAWLEVALRLKRDALARLAHKAFAEEPREREPLVVDCDGSRWLAEASTYFALTELRLSSRNRALANKADLVRRQAIQAFVRFRRNPGAHHERTDRAAFTYAENVHGELGLDEEATVLVVLTASLEEREPRSITVLEQLERVREMFARRPPVRREPGRLPN